VALSYIILIFGNVARLFAPTEPFQGDPRLLGGFCLLPFARAALASSFFLARVERFAITKVRCCRN
jgi:hypothetical protein